MEDPVLEIEGVIRSLTQSKPSIQRQTINRHFTSDASFTHPFCRTGSFDGSRLLIWAIYRWYKTMSPRIDLKVDSIAYDSSNMILYVNISQIFHIFVIPFYSAPVNLTTVLRLKYDKFDKKYYIKSQNDLYEVDQFAKFALPGSWVVIYLWHFLATLLCLLLAAICWPVSWLEEELEFGDQHQPPDTTRPNHTIGLLATSKNQEGMGSMLTAPAIKRR